MNICLPPMLQGCTTGAALIIEIGAQNAFVLKQRILRNHVFVTAFICALIDAILINLGVGGLGTLLTQNTILLLIARWGGAAFLFYYGFRAFRAVFKTSRLKIEDNEFDKPDFKASIFTVFVLSLLNPHVYLDTVILLGSIGSQFPSHECPFALRAMLASFIWFFSLAYEARYLRPLFQKPLA